jgi:methionine-S-sulfoxide reductase
MQTRIATALLSALLLARCVPASSAEPRREPTPNGPRETAILAGGCFWGVEQWMRNADGVASVEVGYVGGRVPHATYDEVSEGNTGHAEAVKIVFDPSVTSYEQLLLRFYKIHDPTTKNRQGNDVGTQYRSAIFPLTDAQRTTAKVVSTRVELSRQWRRPLSTTIESPTNWSTAEDYHQDYLVKHPGGYDNHYLRKLTF